MQRNALKSDLGLLSSCNQAVNNNTEHALEPDIPLQVPTIRCMQGARDVFEIGPWSDLLPNGILDLVVLQRRRLEALQGRSGSTGLLLLIISHHGEIHVWEEEEEQEEEEDSFSV